MSHNPNKLVGESPSFPYNDLFNLAKKSKKFQ